MIETRLSTFGTALGICALAMALLSLKPPLAAAPTQEPAVVAAAQVIPAVVNISSERVIRQPAHSAYDAWFEKFFGASPEPRQRQQSRRVQNLGSGFLIDADGHIVTNSHVVERAAEMSIQVTLHDGTTYPGIYLAGDPNTDLALIKIHANQPLPYLDLAAQSPNHLGQTVLAIGNALGYGNSVTRGILSAQGRTVVVGNARYENLLQTDVAINPGNSGGPLIDLAGRLVGVSSVKLAYTEEGVPAQGIGFAIPATVVKERVDYLRTVPPPRAKAVRQPGNALGLWFQDLTPELAQAMGYPTTEGVLVTRVAEGSPAASAGLERGLAIFRIGQYFTESADFAARICSAVPAGTKVKVTYGRVVDHFGSSQMVIRTVDLIATE